MPVPDVLVRYGLPEMFWPASRHLARFMRSRMLLAKIQMTSSTSSRFEARLSPRGKLDIRQTGDGSSMVPARDLVENLSRALSGSPFLVLPSALVHLKGSGAYVGGLDPTAGPLAASNTGELLPGVHLLDGSLFPRIPAQSPTFTIMANAHRIATSVAG